MLELYDESKIILKTIS